LSERLHHHPKLRPEQPMAIARQWAATMPIAFLISLPASIEHTKGPPENNRVKEVVDWAI
jgi:hypothetical protein